MIGDKPWVRHAERSMFACYDDNFFATQFHIDLFTKFKNKDIVETEQVDEVKLNVLVPWNT